MSTEKGRRTEGRSPSGAAAEKRPLQKGPPAAKPFVHTMPVADRRWRQPPQLPRFDSEVRFADLSAQHERIEGTTTSGTSLGFFFGVGTASP